MKPQSTVLILGATGMLGHTLFRSLSQNKNLHVFGTTRNPSAKKWFAKNQAKNLLTNIDVLNSKSLESAFKKTKPDIVINCIGLIKQVAQSQEVMHSIPVNAIFPHQLAYLTKEYQARLILMSTDCVFSGKKGNYSETDPVDCTDLYGQSKALGEIIDQPHVLTIRTSIIGHELRGGHSLVNWFLKQRGSILGYTRAIYSGLPTIEVAHIIRDHVLPNAKLHGLYQIASDPISKFELLGLIAKTYRKKIGIQKTNTPKINRSLSYAKFQKKTGYQPKSWHQLIEEMYADYCEHY